MKPANTHVRDSEHLEDVTYSEHPEADEAIRALIASREEARSDYTHECPQSGLLLIDKNSSEFQRCKCFQPTPQILATQDALAVQLDLRRGVGGELLQ